MEYLACYEKFEVNTLMAFEKSKYFVLFVNYMNKKCKKLMFKLRSFISFHFPFLVPRTLLKIEKKIGMFG